MHKRDDAYTAARAYRLAVREIALGTIIGAVLLLLIFWH